MEKQLAFKYIKSRKKKNIIGIITIMLVTAFLTAICIYGYSYNKMNFNMFISIDGSHHGIVESLKDEDFHKIKKHADVKDVGKVMSVHSQSNQSADIYYNYYNSKALDYYNLKVVKGEYPKDNLNVAVDRLYAEKFNKNIGDTISVLDKNFKIVGITDNLDYKREDEKVYKVYMSESFAKEVGAESLALVELNDINTYEESFESIRKLLGLEKESIFINETMVDIEIAGLSEVGAFILIGVLIVLSAFFIIYNIFYIALGERIKAIGLLLTIGVTGRQVRKIVLYEAMFLSLIAIPIGALIGFIASKVLIENLYVNGDLRLLIHPIILPSVLALTLLTVVISVILPSIKVSKLSPIEASKFTVSSKTSYRKKPKKEGKNFFRDFAKSNIWRNKKATIVTTISMVLSITLFIISATVFRSMSIENLVKSNFISNVQVDLEYKDSFKGNYIKEDIINPIKSIDKVKNVTGLKTIGIERENIVGITEDILKQAESKLLKGKIDVKEFKEGKVAIVPNYHKSSEYKIGEEIQFKDKSGENKSIKVAAIIKEPIVSMFGSGVYVYNDSKIFSNTNEFIKVLVDTKEVDSKIVSKKVEQITSKYKNLQRPQNYLDTYEDLKKEKRGIVILGYVIVGVIGLIGIMNFVNSTIAGIMSRRKEIGMLRAVGITDNEVKYTLMQEGLYQIGLSLGIGIVLGNILGALGVYLLGEGLGATFIVYTMPIFEILLCIVVVIITLILVTKIATNRIIKDSIIEQIRFED